MLIFWWNYVYSESVLNFLHVTNNWLLRRRQLVCITVSSDTSPNNIFLEIRYTIVSAKLMSSKCY